MRLLLIAVLALGCKSREAAAPPKFAVDPVGEAETKAFAEQFVTLAKPCDEAKLAAVIDQEAMAAKFAKRSTLPHAATAAANLARMPIGARILCAWMRGIESYKLLRVRAVDGQPRPVFRRTIIDPRTGAVVVGYDELELGTSRRDKQVRIVDAFSWVQGQWVTQLLGGNLDGAASLDFLGDLPQMAETVREAQRQQRAGQNQLALDMIDRLPKQVRDVRGVQLLRIRAAAGISKERYKQALDELAAVAPNDPSIAMVQADGAFSLGDFDAALRWIDMIDKAIGGDAMQASHRALAYLRRKQPGDLDKAAEAAAAAIAMEPTLQRAWEVKLDVALGQQKWADAVAAMTELETKHGVTFDEAKLAATPEAAGLLASAEYKAYVAQRK